MPFLWCFGLFHLETLCAIAMYDVRCALWVRGCVQNIMAAIKLFTVIIINYTTGTNTQTHALIRLHIFVVVVIVAPPECT